MSLSSVSPWIRFKDCVTSSDVDKKITWIMNNNVAPDQDEKRGINWYTLA